MQGESTAQAWELVASLGQTTLTVGSGAQSTWQVRAEGVRPIHLTFHWDGATLRVADLGGSGDARVGGSPVGSSWVSLAGHARLEFGAAVLMVDTSAPRAGDSEHPLDPAQAASAPPPAFTEPGSGPMPRLHKATLLGVAASEVPPAPKPVGDTPASGVIDAAALVQGDDPGTASDGDFRVTRPTDSERVRKATLLGAAVSIPPPASMPAAPPASPPAATPSRGLSTGTLMGVVNPMDLRFPRPSHSSSPAAQSDKGDVRTIIGMPMSDAGLRSAIGTAATQTDLRPLSPVPPGPAGSDGPAERIASTWQEDAGSARPSFPELQRDPFASGARPVEHARVPPAQGVPLSGSSPRHGGPDASRAVEGPKRSFPLQYIGIVVLTCAAYFAWLYLLDHW